MRRKAVFLVLIILICTLASCGQKHDVALNFVPKDNVAGIASATPRPEERASITEAGNTETPEPSVDNTLEITNEAAQPSENIPTKEPLTYLLIFIPMEVVIILITQAMPMLLSCMTGVLI